MVRAILEGRKTQTRRLNGLKDLPPGATFDCLFIDKGLLYARFRVPGLGLDQVPCDVRSPYGKKGDLLWCKETWRETGSVERSDGKIPTLMQVSGCHDCAVYRADREWDGPWRQSIYMPKWACRIWLEITDVRVERVQDITPLDVWHEGVWRAKTLSYEKTIPELRKQCKDIYFKSLWNSINLKRGFGWDSNPWVWVIKFKRIER